MITEFTLFTLLDGTEVRIQFDRVEAIIEVDSHVKILLGGQWLELRESLGEFIKKCN